MEFQKKAATMATITSTKANKSPKVFLYTPIISLLKTLDRKPLYFSINSYSCHISIFFQPLPPTPSYLNLKKKKKKQKGVLALHNSWLAEFDSIVALLFPHPSFPSARWSSLVWALIITVECKDLGSAQSLVSIVISCWFRESCMIGVHKRVIIQFFPCDWRFH